ncbi:MAG: thioredoxin fold domain-containing protein [Saprospiraceae bacterium]|nr:thioredoxin fold domain-containing protein [Saprospiraceae bacterium]
MSALLCTAGSIGTEKGKYTGAQQSEPPVWFKQSFLDFEEDVQEAAAANKRVMLYFHQDGCPYCSLLVRDNFQQPDIAADMQQNLDSIAINMWGDREVVSLEGSTYTEKSLAAALRVNYTPTLVFLDEQGKVALRLDGYYPPDRFRMALEYVRDHKEKEMEFHEYVMTQLPVPEHHELNREAFFLAPPYALARHIIHADRPLAILFERPVCRNCDLLHERILANPQTRDLLEQFDAVQLDMQSDTPVITPDGRKTTAREWAGELNLGFAPSMVLFDKQGVEVMRIDAFIKTFHFQSVLDYVLQEAYKAEPSFQRFISARAEHLRESGIDVNIWDY